MTVFSPSNEMMTISLLIYPGPGAVPLGKWPKLEAEPPQDAFEKLMAGKAGG
jgi:hypothetical protein